MKLSNIILAAAKIKYGIRAIEERRPVKTLLYTINSRPLRVKKDFTNEWKVSGQAAECGDEECRGAHEVPLGAVSLKSLRVIPADISSGWAEQ